MPRYWDGKGEGRAPRGGMTPPFRPMDLAQAAAYTPPVEHNTAEGGATE